MGPERINSTSSEMFSLIMIMSYVAWLIRNMMMINKNKGAIIMQVRFR